MKPFSRGIAPELLLTAVRNTMPYLFEDAEGARLEERFPPARTLRTVKDDVAWIKHPTVAPTTQAPAGR